MIVGKQRLDRQGERWIIEFQVFNGFISAMPKLRTVLIWMLMLTMPLQAMAGMRMHFSAAMQLDSSLHATSVTSIEQSPEHCHDPVSAEQKQVDSSSCSHCTACMSAAAIGSALVAPGVPSSICIALGHPEAPLAAIADTPERPPRFSLA